MQAKKYVSMYALVDHDFDQYKVYPNGYVEKWSVSDLNVDGTWIRQDESDATFLEVQAAGLGVLK